MTTPGGGEPRTIDVRLAGPAQTQTFTLPPGVTFDVEAVYIEVDATGAGGAVTAELSIAEQSGVVIARKQQKTTIPAGATGSATWALRLDDESATSTAGGGINYVTFPQNGSWLYSETTDATGSPNGWGTELYDSSAAGDGIEIHSDNGNLNYFCGGNANFSGFNTTVSASFLLTLSCASIILSSSAQVKQEQSTALGGQRFTVSGLGGKHTVRNSLGTALFEVWGDGSIHGRAAVGAITWDL